MTTQDALKAWQRFYSSDRCCDRSHYVKLPSGSFTPVSDVGACQRELAWRQYVRLRDDNANFPFGILLKESNDE